MTKPKTPTSPTNAQPEVRPLESWKVQTGFGTLQTFSGEKLVRLEDVHIWMCDNGKPPKDAVYEVFSPFYMACLDHAEGGGLTALELPSKLELINATTYPNGVIKEGDLSKVQAVKFYASAFPELGHVRFADGSLGGLVYAMAEGALRVWNGHADISTDHLEIAKRRKERKTDETYAIQWPSDEDLRKLLGRLAVPISTAYELWKWGSVAEVVHLVSAPPSLTAQDIKDGAGKNKRGEWSDEARALMVAARVAAKVSGEKIEDVAKKFGMTRQAFSGVTDRTPKGTRSKVEKPAQQRATR